MVSFAADGEAVAEPDVGDFVLQPLMRTANNKRTEA